MTAAVAALAVWATPAAAYDWSGCGGGNFATCASFNVTASAGSSSTRSKITLVIQNLSGLLGTWGGTVFTQIGLHLLPAGTTIHPTTLKVNGAASDLWELKNKGNGFEGTGITDVTAFVDTKGNQGVEAGAPWTFTFELSRTQTVMAYGCVRKGGPTGCKEYGLVEAQQDMENPFANYVFDDLALHGQKGPNGCSTKLVVTNGVANTGPYDANCGGWEPHDPPPLATPEPATMTLLGSGLAGLAGLRARRRKQR